MANEETINRHFLYPGTFFADPREFLISTILGSCVSVCMWDAVSCRGGMNHYMLSLWNGEGLATPKYGNIAVEKLLAKMLAIGCRREHLTAKLFGGANVVGAGSDIFMIGDRNITLAYDLLKDYDIPVEACDVGGNAGRKVIMNTATGVIFVGMGKLKKQRGSLAACFPDENG